MDDDTRAEVALYDALETDPTKRELMLLLYQMEILTKATEMTPANRQQGFLALIDQAREQVRMLPDSPPQHS